MTSDVSNLHLTSALSMNAASCKMKTLIDQRMAETRRNKPYTKDLEVDMNMVISNKPWTYTVGTSFERHPPYPKLGNRVIHINNQSRSMSYVRSTY